MCLPSSRPSSTFYEYSKYFYSFYGILGALCSRAIVVMRDNQSLEVTYELLKSWTSSPLLNTNQFKIEGPNKEKYSVFFQDV